MKFVYLGPFRFPDGDAAASRVLNNARILRDLGHQVTILSFGGHYRDEDYCDGIYENDGLNYVITNDMDTHSWRERAIRYVCPYPNCRKWMRLNLRLFDVVISYDPTYAFNQWMIPFCKLHRKKLICDITEWYGAGEMPGGKWSPAYWCSEWNMRHTLKRIPNKILISSFLNNQYPESNNIIVPPLIDIRDWKWNQDVSVIKHPGILAHQGVKILYAGTPSHKELLGNLIEAAIQLLENGEDRIQLIVAGVTKEKAITLVNNDSRILKYPRNLVFLGRIPQALVAAYYQLCDFSAIIRERTRKNMAGFPTKMVESMAAGCPVIMTNTSDLRKYAQDEKNAYYLKDTSIDEIVLCLKRIFALTSSQLAVIKHSAKDCAECNFDYRNHISEFDTFINKITFDKNGCN